MKPTLHARIPVRNGLVAHGVSVALMVIGLISYQSAVSRSWRGYADTSTASMFFVLAGIAAIVGLICLAIGLYRVVVTIDALGDAHADESLLEPAHSPEN